MSQTENPSSVLEFNPQKLGHGTLTQRTEGFDVIETKAFKRRTGTTDGVRIIHVRSVKSPDLVVSMRLSPGENHNEILIHGTKDEKEKEIRVNGSHFLVSEGGDQAKFDFGGNRLERDPEGIQLSFDQLQTPQPPTLMSSNVEGVASNLPDKFPSNIVELLVGVSHVIENPQKSLNAHDAILLSHAFSQTFDSPTPTS